MNTEKNFYEILQSKFSEQEQPFDEANWKSMRKMIDDSRAKKKRALWLASSLVFLLLAVGTYSIIEWKAGNGKSSVISSQNTVVNNPKQISATNTKAQPGATNSNSGNLVEASNNAVTTNNIGNRTNSNTDQFVTSKNPVVASALNSPKRHTKTSKHNYYSSGGQVVTGSFKTTQANNAEVKVANQNIAATKISGNISGERESSTPNPKTNSTPPLTQAKPPVNGTAHRPDTAIVGLSQPLRFSEEPRVFNGKEQMISIEAGVYGGFGWQIGTINQGRGINYVFGLGYSHYLASKWFLKTGIQFSEYGNLGTLPYTYSTLTFQNAKVVNNDSLITTKRVYYLSIPIQFEHFNSYNGKFSIGFGGTISYLLGSKGSATTEQIIDNGSPVNIHNYSQNIQINGFNKLNGSVYLLARYVFSHHFSAYCMPYYMTPVEKMSFFGSNKYLGNGGVKVLLSYAL